MNVLLSVLTLITCTMCSRTDNPPHKYFSATDTSKIKIEDSEWRKILSPQLYRIARLQGTERPGTSPYEHAKAKGVYYCAACGLPLFKSDTKYDSGCGWPSFFQPIQEKNIVYKADNSLGMTRTEIRCARCGAHLGHVFKDGPAPTGLRYCLNGISLLFIEEGTQVPQTLPFPESHGKDTPFESAF